MARPVGAKEAVCNLCYRYAYGKYELKLHVAEKIVVSNEGVPRGRRPTFGGRWLSWTRPDGGTAVWKRALSVSAKLNRFRCGAGWVCLLLLLASTSLPAADSGFTPVYHPQLQIAARQGEIRIDGDLSDPGWTTASRAGNFAEHSPGDQTKPPVETEVMVTYDESRFYVAWLCYDDPSTVRSSLCERDNIFSDDFVMLLLDTYGDASWAYELGVNPYGIQGDLLWSATGGEDEGFDLIYESAAKVTDFGWQVEMAVPFASMRFPDREEQTWRVDFWRNHPRQSRAQYSWAAYDRNEPCWPCRWGTLTGIKGVVGGSGLELLPTVVSYQSGQVRDYENPRSGFDNDRVDGELSLNAKYALTSAITAEASYNPDFSQIESDAAEIDVNSNYALSFEERRPFFQEGSDLFRTYFDAVYTRSINDPQAAAKITGRPGRTSLAYLVARDEHSPVILPFGEHSHVIAAGKSYSNVLRVRRSFGEDSHVGMIATDRRFDGGGSGSLGGLDARIRLTKSCHLMTQVLVSYTDEPNNPALTKAFDDESFDEGQYTAGFDGEHFGGNALTASLEYDSNHLFSELEFTQRSPTFRADLGFEPRNDTREANFYTQYRFDHETRVLEWICPNLTLGRLWDYTGEQKDEWIRAQLEVRLKRQTWTQFGYLGSWEKLRGVEFPGIRRFYLNVESDFSRQVGVGLFVSKGHLIARNEEPPRMGDQSDLEIWGTLKPVDRLRISPSISYVYSEDVDTGERFFEGYVTRTKVSLQASRETSLRLIMQYDDFSETWNIDPLVTYRLSPFSVFYIGSTTEYSNIRGCADSSDGFREIYHRNWRLTSRQFFMKLQYLFQV